MRSSIIQSTKTLYLCLALLCLIAAACATSRDVSPHNSGIENGLLDNATAVRPQNSPVPVQNTQQTTAYKVVRVIDGDTVVLLVDGRKTRVRLIGVDTPETVHPSKPVEAFGKEASQFTKKLLEGESVYLEYEEGASRLDKYDRTLAYLYRVPDRLFINAEIIRQGYGHAYTKYPFKYMEEFRSHERAAREAGKGLWGAGATIVSDAEPTISTTTDTPSTTARERAPVSSPTVQKRAPQTVNQTAETTVYVTRTGAKYHRDGCRYLSRSQIPMSLSDARQSYSACSVCRPPQ